ncbi:conserved hypothetical protein [Allopseudospirillum japonicum]|uniref:Purine nucleoside phosphorylase n=1 Tax=Allopseudospirillum japonicum TaxID=64971 RepID=A0A1H6R5G7_9GAMM|nr:peptidoglycan editing factor PgeF [Allopseudospirillum japonicum]SEI50983.1 conserved hypothetical protein [Allopseudospirillum japonicum]
MPSLPTCLHPHWKAPASVHSLVTTREHGPSQAPFAHFNLGDHVGDNSTEVEQCRLLLQQKVGLPLLWLDQVHGNQVITDWPQGVKVPPQADACVSTSFEYACVVLTADCLPIFLCTQAGDQVGVIHAGWRGLAAGVIEASVAAFHTPAEYLLAWLGPAIGPKAFEVGPEVRETFTQIDPRLADAFTPSPYRLNYFMADIYQLARQRLQAMGVHHIYGGGFCTFTDTQRFYSYRREGRTGRMASVIWLAEPESA